MPGTTDISVFVKGNDGTTETIEMQPGDTIGSLKKLYKLKKKTNCNFRFVILGKQPDDTATLLDSRITNEQTVHAQDIVKYTLEEVQRHNKETDMWLAIHGNVYDVTDFRQKHPGGPELLNQHAGTDASEAFEEDAARKLMNGYLIGKLENYRGKTFKYFAQHSRTSAKVSMNKRNKIALVTVVIAALAGLHRFLQTPNAAEARAGVAFARDGLGKSSALGRRDALALLRASNGLVQARILLRTRAEIMDYLLALKGFEHKQGSVNEAPLCSEEDVRAKLRRLVRRSSAMTREQWVALFPCILEITITDPDRQGRRRRTDVTCEMISREPWLALGRLPQDTTK